MSFYVSSIGVDWHQKYFSDESYMNYKWNNIGNLGKKQENSNKNQIKIVFWIS
jgi:hypothetical protein